MRIYKTTDKIEYKLGELSIKISPLSVDDKNNLTELMFKGQQKADVKLLMEGSLYALQCAIKEIKGLEDGEGNPFELSFDDSGKLTKECASDLLNLEQSSNLIGLCSSFINGVPTKLPEGITLVESKKPKNPKAQK